MPVAEVSIVRVNPSPALHLPPPVDQYSLFAPQRIEFGWGRAPELGALAASLGQRAFVVCGSRRLRANGRLQALLSAMREAGVRPIELEPISREPLVEDVDRRAAFVRDQRPGPGDLLLGIGGGSAIDLAKAVAAMATNTQARSVADFLEGVGTGARLSAAPLPVLALPTTGGTGSEATKNAVISCLDPPFKKSLRSESLVPRAVLIDPELAVDVSPRVTAWTGMDAMTQLIESYVSNKRKPIPRALALDGLAHAAGALLNAVANGHCRTAREAMAHAALISGVCLANSGLGLAHGVAAALGVHCQVPHGLACAVMLPAALRANAECCQEDFAVLAAAMVHGGVANASSITLLERVEGLLDQLEIPRRLRDIGVAPGQIGAIARDSAGNSTNGNPREIGTPELAGILQEMW
jgi:alcohol dehydrogenase class IV